MSAFIETTIYERDALVNVDAIEMIMPDSEGEHSIIRFRRPFEQTQEDGTMVCDGLQYNEDEALEPYESLKAKILAAYGAVQAAEREGKRNLPPTPPIKSKEEVQQVPPAHACEENLTCEGVLIPTLDEVKAAAPGIGVDTETAENFWNFFCGLGWKYKGDTIRNWRFMLKAWKNTRSRLERRDEKLIAHFDEKADKRQAHIDAKMDEREAKRERRMGGRRKADNNVEMSDEVREEVRRDFTF